MLPYSCGETKHRTFDISRFTNTVMHPWHTLHGITTQKVPGMILLSELKQAM